MFKWFLKTNNNNNNNNNKQVFHYKIISKTQDTTLNTVTSWW